MHSYGATLGRSYRLNVFSKDYGKAYESERQEQSHHALRKQVMRKLIHLSSPNKGLTTITATTTILTKKFVGLQHSLLRTAPNRSPSLNEFESCRIQTPVWFLCVIRDRNVTGRAKNARDTPGWKRKGEDELRTSGGSLNHENTLRDLHRKYQNF